MIDFNIYFDQDGNLKVNFTQNNFLIFLTRCFK